MKVFVSAELDDREAINELQSSLRASGHSLSHDWSVTEILPPEFDKNATKAADIAKLNIDGVLNADIFTILTSNEKQGAGMYTELGVALARAEMGTLKDVLVIGERLHETVFYYHPRVRHFDTISECVAYINATHPETVNV